MLIDIHVVCIQKTDLWLAWFAQTKYPAAESTAL